MSKKNIRINAVLNVVKSCLSVVFPLITYPIVLQTLGTVGIGKIDYVQSVISYFAMFAMLGVSTYAVREGAPIRDDKIKLKKFVSEVITINLVFTVVSIVLLFAAALLIPPFRGYLFLFSILWVQIIFRTFALDWVNTIFEDYLFITIRTIVTYIISLVLIILFIKSPEDYWIYAILLLIPNGVICVCNWLYCRRYVSIGFTKSPNFGKHLKPLFILFFYSIMVTIYVNFDTTMLGWIKGDYHVGVYSLSVKVYTIMKNIMTAIYAVAVARLSAFAESEKWPEFRELFSKMCSALTIILMPVSVGIICVSKEIVAILGGDEYFESVHSLRILAFALIFAIFSGLVNGCLCIPLKKEKILLIATTISAAANFVLNLFFIPWFNSTGAAITTVIAEATVLIICLIKIPNKKQYIDFRMVGRSVVDSLIGIVGIVIYSLVIRYYIHSFWPCLITIILGSVILYFVVMLLRRNTFVFDVIHNIISKLQGAHQSDESVKDSEIAQSQKDLLESIKGSLFGVEPNYSSDIKWDEVVEEAKAHTVMALISPVIPVQDETSEHCKAKYMRIMFEQDRLIKCLDAADIPCVILKGSAAAINYPKPYLRAMGDIDVLVPRDRFVEAVELLENNGYIYDHGKEDDELITDETRELSYNKNGVLIEIHQRFSSKGFEVDDILESAISRREYLNLNGYRFPVLPAPENCLVLLGHINQHLNQDRIGLRQIIDWEMYVHSVQDKSFWNEQFIPLAEETGLLTLAANVTRMCNRHLGLNDEVDFGIDVDDSLVDELFEIILSDGNFGRKVLSINTKDEKKTFSVSFDIKKYGFFGYFVRVGQGTSEFCMNHPKLKILAFFYGFFRLFGRGIRAWFKNRDVGKKLGEGKKMYEIHSQRSELFKELGVRSGEE